MTESIPSETLKYHQHLSLLVTSLPIPPPSFDNSPILSSLTSAGLVHCPRCDTLLVHGVNCSMLTRDGQRWKRCERCRKVSKIGLANESEQMDARKSFESVKKRRRRIRKDPRVYGGLEKVQKDPPQDVEQKQRIGSTGRAAGQPSVAADQANGVATSDGTHSITKSLPTTSSAAAPPSISRSATQKLELPSLTAATSSSTSTNAPKPQALTLDARMNANKKMKRSKQATSLAALLEAKKKSEAIDQKGGGSMGLNDFLQSM